MAVAKVKYDNFAGSIMCPRFEELCDGEMSGGGTTATTHGQERCELGGGTTNELRRGAGDEVLEDSYALLLRLRSSAEPEHDVLQ